MELACYESAIRHTRSFVKSARNAYPATATFNLMLATRNRVGMLRTVNPFGGCSLLSRTNHSNSK